MTGNQRRMIPKLMPALVLALAISGCGQPAPVATSAQPALETTPAQTTAGTVAEPGQTEAPQITVDLSQENQSVALPAGYPIDVMPLFPDSYLESTVSLDDSFSLVAHSKSDVDTVTAYFKDILKNGKVNMESDADGQYTAFGTIDKYTFQLTIGPEPDRDDFETLYAILLMPE
jgi:hypothetical protein